MVKQVVRAFDGLAALPAFPATQIDALLVSECPANLECRVVHRVACRGSHEWFIGKVEVLA